MSTAVVLFTRDLRTHDQPALAHAVRTHAHVVPLFVLDDAILASVESANRLSFLLDALDDLRVSLRERGADLVVRRGDPVVQTLRIASAVDAQSLYVGGDASAYARERERRLQRACAAERIDLRVVDTTTIVPPGAFTPAGRDHYRVFTPYWRRWQASPLRDVLPAPKRVQLPPDLEPGELPALRSLTSLATSPELEPGGERAARDRLARAGSEESSRLSAHLHFGCISPVEVATSVRDRPHGDEFLRRLCWRDFFLQLLAANPSLPRKDLRRRREPWRVDDEALARWREGSTGYPIVDAGMRHSRAKGGSRTARASSSRPFSRKRSIRIGASAQSSSRACSSMQTSRATSATGSGSPGRVPTRGRTAFSIP
jgi:deoxyribodipyrimidine photo-lyase